MTPAPLPHPDSPARLYLEVLSVQVVPLGTAVLEPLVRNYSRGLGLSLKGRPVSHLQELLETGHLTFRNGGLVVPRPIADPVLAEVVRSGRLRALERAVEAGRMWSYDRNRVWRDLRLALFSGNAPEVRRALGHAQGHRRDHAVLPALLKATADLDWLDFVPADFQRTLVAEAFVEALAQAVPQPRVDQWLRARADRPDLRLLLCERLFLQGHLEEARSALRGHPHHVGTMLLRVAEGRWDEAREAARTVALDPSGYLGVMGPSMLPLLLVTGPAADHDLARSILSSLPSTETVQIVSWLSTFVCDPDRRPPNLPEGDRGLRLLLGALAHHWSGSPAVAAMADRLRAAAKACRKAGHAWLADQFAALTQEQPPTGSLVALLPRMEGWRRSLAGLSRLAATLEPRPEPVFRPQEERVAWFFDPRRETLEGRVQKVSARGGWTPGRSAQGWKLSHHPSSTPADRRAAEAHARNDLAAALEALAGHPLLFDDRGRPLEITVGTPALRLARGRGRLKLELTPSPRGRTWILCPESGGRYVLYRLSQLHQKVHNLVDAGMDFPPQAEPELREALAGLARGMVVVSDLELESSLEEVEPDSTLLVLLRPEGEGLRVELKVAPLGERGPLMEPGRGGAILVGQGAQTRRDLREEGRRRAGLEEACPILAARLASSGLATDLEGALELLEDLGRRPEGVELRWPEGERLQVRRTLRPEDLRLALSRRRDWFQLEGEARVDEETVLELQRLLSHARGSGSRFVALGEGRFLALTAGLRRRLDELADLTTARGHTLEVHPLAGLAVEEMRGEVAELRTDEAWKSGLEAMRRAMAMKPRVPKALQAELRDYQADGYRWLVRLSHWAPGACLADDMGLGKTVQTLALLLQRAGRGAALVVAPTSVCANWAQEAARFAPSLRVHVLAESERQALLGGIAPGDLVVCSYGLLVREAEALAQVGWATVVLDEAQGIKNPATRRFKAAVSLPAEFRLATTGTPVENRLDELWALFRFLSPGLLGSRERFHRRFASPIEENQDAGARERLRRLVRPFLLRRTKDQVLRELPPRTEVELLVEPHPQERALYEALRRQAVERLEQDQEDPGQRRFQVLAELMRLRRAACHPRLVAPDSDLPSSKMDLFRELLEELRAEEHRVLVFSQFVDHLALAREVLEESDLSYQYLDGATPARERARRVKAFQGGEGDVFLISLRAGGTGLNLTGADYVVHLDPWWNPAVEDQASDRAHRLGQTRPVTIYRLVAKGTLEEKIVRLHADKRQLAEGLLAGAETPAAWSVEELARLLHEGP